MRAQLSLLAACLLLGACTTPQERALKMQADMDRIIQTYGPACTTLGYQTNSDPWRNCILQLNTRDDLQHYGYGPAFYGGYGRSHWGGGGLWGPYW